MPQPIYFTKQISFDFTPSVILQRPKLAPHIAVISAIWNDIEAHIGMFLTALLGGEAKTGISIFYAITNDGAKKAATEAICTLKLTPAQMKALQKLLKTVGERSSDRNNAVHGAWGISPEYPKSLLWGDTRDMVLLHVDLLSFTGPEHREHRSKLMLKHQKLLKVWNEADFIETEKRLTAAYKELVGFSKPFIDRAFSPKFRPLVR